jgi:UDP-N-acetylmuramate: L-alanyl-gamma-D-glutamyl-meso-diaminopimelate ligase
MERKRAHFIGIAGKGMSATALLLRELGWEIGGSDEGFYPPVSDYLRTANIPFAAGYRKENIHPEADLVVIGKNAKLVPESNEEVAAAFASGKRVCSFPDVLRDLTVGAETLVVAGSYGKSTCAALAAWCLKQADKDPSYFVGEVIRGFASYAHKGSGCAFVLEGDEYPSANWDPTSKFLHYNARNILLTSATHDHVNVFRTHEDYLAPFRILLRSLPPDGVLVVNSGEEHAHALANASAARTVFYALGDKGQWHAQNISYGLRTTFDLMNGRERTARLATGLLGAHNIENIVGVSALLLEKAMVDPGELARGVASFEGVKRRLEHLSPLSRVPVFEGFGSSYEKARSAIAAMALHFPARRLLVVFEPHAFTWRNRAALPQYDDAFVGAHKIFIYEPAAQGAATHAQLTQAEIVSRVKAAGFDVEPMADAAQGLQDMAAELREDDCVLLLTSGDLGGLIKSVPALAERRFPL